ncbi:16S rRNA (cytosine(967)-C(5))-methyltransferase RsmB [Luteimonas pelagia]
MEGVRPRVIAAQVLDAVLHRGRSLRTELAAKLPTIADVRDRALVEAICHAALRHHARYADALATWMPKPPGRRDAPLRALLYAGFAQLDPLGLPTHAAVSATVDAARQLGRAHQSGLVNALLRRAVRDGLPTVDPAAQWPAWLRDLLAADWPGDVEAILEASATAAPMWLRVNARATTRDAYLDRLREVGIEAAAVAGLPDAIRLATPVPVAALPGFDDGLASVQDGAAQAVADALAPAAGARVLDMCAAPGGKAAHLLERDPSLRLVALDVDGGRLDRVRATLARLHLDGTADLRVADGATPESWWDGTPFDAVLLDAPCSATGIVRRQPDVLLHRRPSDLDALRDLQARLLDAAWRVLRPGGTLLYATCSILADENARQVDAFLARTPDARTDPLPDAFGRVAGPGRQRLPGEGGMDGFFYARLRRDG